MTDKDRKLVEQASTLRYTEWEQAQLMADQADSPETRETLRAIALRLHCVEEEIANRQ